MRGKEQKSEFSPLSASVSVWRNCSHHTCLFQILLSEEEEPMIVFLANEKLCHCYLHDEQFPLSLQHCQEALNIHRTPDVHCDKAEVYIATEMYDDGEYHF